MGELKFHSMGNAKQQAEDRALVTRLCGEIGSDGYLLLDKADRIFIDDIRFKLRSTVKAQFGKKAVAHIQVLAEKVRAARGEGRREGTK